MFSPKPFSQIPGIGSSTQLVPSNAVESERHFTAKEVAEAWNLSQDTIYRLFVNEPGVLLLVSEKKKYRRTRRTLRIPESVKSRVYRRLQSVTGKEGVKNMNKRVILSMGGKGGVGKTSVITGLAEWFRENQSPVKLLDLDTGNKARGSPAHFFGEDAPKVNIHTPAGLDSFVDELTDGPPVILADMGAGAGQVTYDWFDRMYPDVSEAGILFTAILPLRLSPIFRTASSNQTATPSARSASYRGLAIVTLSSEA